MPDAEEIRNGDGTFKKGASGNRAGRRPKVQPLPAQVLIPGNFDGWYSAQTGIGTSTYDKRLSHHQAPVRITYQEALLIWSTDDLGRRALQDPIEDAFRPGFVLDIQDIGDFDDLKVATAERMTQLKVVERIVKAMCMERALGGSAILIGARDHRPLSAPLDVSRAHGIDWLTVLEPIEIQPYTYYTSVEGPDAAKYGEPETYQLTAFTTAGAANSVQIGERAPPNQSIIHETRLIVFGGIRVSRYQQVSNVAGPLWGESMLTSFYEPLRDLNVGYHSAAILATEVGEPTISMPNLMGMVAKDPDGLRKRMLALHNGRSSSRVLLVDDKETVARQSGDHLTGVPELLNALAIRFAASIPMPLSRLLGQAPKALGNESDSETRFYYDDLRSIQVHRAAPILRGFAMMIMQSVRKRRLPKRWSIKFLDLTQLTDVEMAEAHLTQARTDSMVIKSGVATPDEIRRSRYINGYSFDTKVDETKKAPGFVAPPPHGTPGSPTNPGPGGKPGLTSHAVTSYTRKNPTSKGTEPAAKQGGDVAPKRDARFDASSEMDYLIQRRTALESTGVLGRATADLLGAIDDLARKEWAEHQAGQCDPEECLLPHGEDGESADMHVMFAGFSIVVENTAGSVRSWVAQDGTSGQTLMRYDYGYIEGTMGQDVDEVDVYLGPDETSRWVFAIDQLKAPDFTQFDEQKVMLGFSSAAAATAAYIGQYDDERFFGGMSQMPLENFRQKVFSGAGRVINDGSVVAP